MTETVLPGEELLKIRRLKLDELRARGVDPYGHRFEVTQAAQNVIDRFPELEHQTVRLAGRVMAIRRHGKATFVDLQDASGRIQLYVKADSMGEEDYAFFGDLDLGDIIGVEGPAFRTRRGEISVEIRHFHLLAKSLRPLPEKWHGLKDVDIRYRRRYLDLIANPEVRDVFVLRSKVLASLRGILSERGFLEVETPMMHSVPGGAAARPFITHHNALDLTLFLRIAPELYLKRLIVGGMEKVFELGRVFRNEGISTRHNPEFTILEIYEAYADYGVMMDLTERIISQVARETCGGMAVTFLGHKIDLTPPWRRLPIVEALREFADIDLDSFSGDREAREAALTRGVDVPATATRGQVVEELVDALVQPKLIQPTFLTDHPVEISPLAKRKADRPDLTERFELIIAGWEMANAFSELNDPIDQRERFEAQLREKEKGNEEAHSMDEDYLTALEYGLPPCGGLGIGVDRLVMMLADASSIRDVILFPLMRPKE